MPDNDQVDEMNEQELLRLQQLTVYETLAREQGFSTIAGVDEAGRGPLAGPVVAAACIIPPHTYIPGVNDSKKMSPQQRADVFKRLTEDPSIYYGIGVISHQIIDSINIYQATIQAMLQAVDNLAREPDLLLVDGMNLKHHTICSQKIIRGDALSQSIAAASVIAKVTRDTLMQESHEQWPHYGFEQHKGYGTPQHLAAIRSYGPCPIHRRSFSPVKEFFISHLK